MLNTLKNNNYYPCYKKRASALFFCSFLVMCRVRPLLQQNYKTDAINRYRLSVSFTKSLKHILYTAYSIQPYHIHCIIKPLNIKDYPKIVKSFKYSFTKNYNVGLVNPTNNLIYNFPQITLSIPARSFIISICENPFSSIIVFTSFACSIPSSNNK